MPDVNPIETYQQFKKAFQAGKGDNVALNAQTDAPLNALIAVYATSRKFLDDTHRTDLTSKVENKEYFSFSKGENQSRAINSALFCEDEALRDRFFHSLKTNEYGALTADEWTRACYTIAITFCAAVDVKKQGDQKTPGTFFEYFIALLIARRIKQNPRRRVDVMNLDADTTLQTDLIFDLGVKQAKYHVPVKISTRERIIQVWAHQRVLDGVYGTGRFLGLMVGLTETKTDKTKGEVVEICLPLQWRLYQMFIAQMKRVYYLDVPEKYASLGEEFPKIAVKPFGEFFSEIDSLPEQF